MNAQIPASHRDLVDCPRVGALTTVMPDGYPQNLRRLVRLRLHPRAGQHDAWLHLDALTRKYTRHPGFYGFVHPAEQQAHETRVTCRIRARRITLDAIHA